MLPRVLLMQSICIPICILSLLFFAASSYAEPVSLTGSMSLDDAEKILTSQNIPHGDKYQLQWAPAPDTNYLFTVLPDEMTLAIHYNVLSRKIIGFIVCKEIPLPTSRSDKALIHPAEIHFNDDKIHLVFTK